MKETREILDNILRMKKSEYELLDMSVSSTTSKPSDRKDGKKVNILPGETEVILSRKGRLEEMENYKPTQELDFEVDEIKDCLEKKKKRRNYIEFRPDYEKS
nr:MAG: hypothetical protein AM325_07410 [Candidatus Thorarchaeota archaeon SMTZ1-45]